MENNKQNIHFSIEKWDKKYTFQAQQNNQESQQTYNPLFINIFTDSYNFFICYEGLVNKLGLGRTDNNRTQLSFSDIDNDAFL